MTPEAVSAPQALTASLPCQHTPSTSVPCVGLLLLLLLLLLPLQGVPDSGITVVRRTSNGAAVYRYDAHGRLLQAPDCYRQHTTPSPQSPSQAQLYHDSTWSSRGQNDFPGSPPAAAHSTPGSKCNKGSSGGGFSSSSGDKGGAGTGNRPGRLLLSSNGGLNEESATAEVFVTLSPRRPGPPHGTGGQDKK